MLAGTETTVDVVAVGTGARSVVVGFCLMVVVVVTTVVVVVVELVVVV